MAALQETTKVTEVEMGFEGVSKFLEGRRLQTTISGSDFLGDEGCD
jgi:hypothetical protein